MLILKGIGDVDEMRRLEAGSVLNPRAIATQKHLLAHHQAWSKHRLPHNPLPWLANINDNEGVGPMKVERLDGRHISPSQYSRFWSNADY